MDAVIRCCRPPLLLGDCEFSRGRSVALREGSTPVAIGVIPSIRTRRSKPTGQHSLSPPSSITTNLQAPDTKFIPTLTATDNLNLAPAL